MQGSSPERTQQTFLYQTLSELLNPKHPLYLLAGEYPWESVEEEFGEYYSETGRPAKPVRLMISLLLLKQMYNLGDETVVEEWIQNPYYQYFSGETTFQWQFPCEPSDLVHFRKRIGESGVKKLFEYSVRLHGKSGQEKTIVADTTVQEKNITYPTDVKLYRKVVLACWRIADKEVITLRQRYSRTIRKLFLLQRFRHHPKNYKKSLRAEKKLKTIAGRLHREIGRKVSPERLKEYEYQLSICSKILSQKRTDTDKLYSLHAPEAYCMSKGKEHKQYEFGSKVSLLKTKTHNIIVGALSFAKNDYDGHTLVPALQQYKDIFGFEPSEVIADRGYRGKSTIGATTITIPKPGSRAMTVSQKRAIRKKFRRRAAIEPSIGHLKSDVGLDRNYLKGTIGDTLNVMLAATAHNLRQWLRKAKGLFASFFLSLKISFRMLFISQTVLTYYLK